MSEAKRDPFEFEVALSFADEDRDYVRDFAEKLIGRGRRVFFDEKFQAEMWGADLPEYLDSVYRERSHYAVVFVSQHYVAKAYPRYEKRSAIARALVEKEPYLLPVRLDDSSLPGLQPTTGYIDSRRTGIDQLVELVEQKLDGLPPSVGERQPWDGKTPRTAAHTSDLLARRPPGWEYLLYAGALTQGIQALEEKYRDHEIRYARRSDSYVSEHEVGTYLNGAMAKVRQLVASVDAVLDAAAQERAFGAPGTPGDVDRILHLADRLARIYEDLMDWAANIRGVAVPQQFQRLFELLAQFVDEPVREFRRFSTQLTDETDQIPEYAAMPEPREVKTIEVTLRLTVREGIVEEYNAEHARWVS